MGVGTENPQNEQYYTFLENFHFGATILLHIYFTTHLETILTTTIEQDLVIILLFQKMFS